MSLCWLILLQISIYLPEINSLNFTLNGGPNGLPTPLFGAICALNSQNQWICIGGCNSRSSSSAHVCYSTYASKDIYLWDVSQTAAYTKIDSIDTVHNLNYLWNPSNGYPYPIDLRYDIMYIPWNGILYQYDTQNKQWINDTNLQIPTTVAFVCPVYDESDHKIYLLGGTWWDADGNQLYPGSFHIYDIDTNDWIFYQDFAPMPISIYGGSCVLFSKTKSIYYFGGRVQGGSSVKSILKYQIDVNQWRTLSVELATEQFGLRSLIIDQTNILIIGGARFCSIMYPNYLFCATAGIWTFNVLNESMQLITTMQHDRYAPQTALIDGHVYIAGGYQVSSRLVLSDSEWSKEIFHQDNYNMSTTSMPTISLQTGSPISSPTSVPVASSLITDHPTISSISIAPTIALQTASPISSPTSVPVASSLITDHPTVSLISEISNTITDNDDGKQSEIVSSTDDSILIVGILIVVLVVLVLILVIIGLICIFKNKRKIDNLENKKNRQRVQSYSVELIDMKDKNYKHIAGQGQSADEGDQSVFTDDIDNNDQVLKELNETSFDNQ